MIHVLSSDAIGGCETSCINLAQALLDAPYRQEVVFLSQGDGQGPTSRQLAEMHVPVHHLPLDPNRLSFLCAFARHCRNRQQPIVACHAFGTHFYVALAARLGGAQKVLAFAGNPPPEKWWPWLSGLFYVQLSRPLVDKEIGCTQYVRNRMWSDYRLPARRLSVLPHAVDIESIRARADRARRGRPRFQGPVLGMIARLDLIKNHAHVLRAFAIILRRKPNARLRLIGNGPERVHLQRLATELGISSQTDFLGTRLDVAEQLGLMDVFVYSTTRDEGFGIVLAEAMAAGVPIVASDIGPCREVLEGSNAHLVPPDDIEGMAHAVSAVLAEDERGRWEQPALNQALQRYTLQAVRSGFISLHAAP